MLRSSLRARCAPRQKCAPPPPNATCGLWSRVTSNSSARSNVRGSRFAAGNQMLTRSPSAIAGRRPRCRTVAVRAKHATGAHPPQDLLDRGRGAATGRRATGPTGRGGRWSATRPPEIAERVVSDPAMVRIRKNWSSSDAVSRQTSPSSPSTSDVVRMLHTSSVGLRRLSSPSSRRVLVQLQCPRGSGPRFEIPASGSGAAMIVSVSRNTSGRSASGMPMMSAIMCMGSWYATSCTKLHVPALGGVVEDLRRAGLELLVEPADHAGREAGADELAHARVAGRVGRHEGVAALLLAGR